MKIFVDNLDWQRNIRFYMKKNICSQNTNKSNKQKGKKRGKGNVITSMLYIHLLICAYVYIALLLGRITL